MEEGLWEINEGIERDDEGAREDGRGTMGRK